MPGTGKTEVVSAFLNSSLDWVSKEGGHVEAGTPNLEPDEVLVTTGTVQALAKARSRVLDPLVPVHSVHSALKELLNDRCAFSNVKVWVVDECNMVSLNLFHQVSSFTVHLHLDSSSLQFFDSGCRLIVSFPLLTPRFSSKS
jgi:hypothetical protein